MPFELGLDHGGARFGEGQLSGKSILILEKNRYDYQKGLSDISGFRIVSSWLIPQAEVDPVGPAKIQGNHLTFQEWYWERETMRGATDDDIRAYPTIQVVNATREWAEAGKPI